MGGKSPKPVSSQTVTNLPPQYIQDAQIKVLDKGQALADRPYNPYTGQLVQGFSGDQNQAFQNIRNTQGMAQPYINAGAGLSFQSAQGVNPMQYSGAAVNQFMNPYLDSVAQSTMNNINQTNQIQQNQLRGNAIAKGAYGGDRAGIAQAELNRNQNLASQQTISGIYDKGYQQAQDMFNKQQAADMTAQQQTAALRQGAAGQIGQFGTDAQKNALDQAKALSASGAQQQELGQTQLSSDYQQFLNQQQYPFQNLSWLTGLISGNNSGGSSTSVNSQAGPSGTSQAIGGLTTLGALAGMKFADGGVVGFAGGGVPYGGGSATPYGNPTIAAKGFGNIFSDGSVNISHAGNGGMGIPKASAPEVKQEDPAAKGMGLLKDVATANSKPLAAGEKAGKSLIDRGKDAFGNIFNPSAASPTGTPIPTPSPLTSGASPAGVNGIQAPNLIEGVGNAVNGIGSAVGEGLGTIGSGIGQGIGALGTGIGEAASGIGGALAGAGGAVAEGIGAAGAGIAGMLAELGPAALFLLPFSDERVKENKEVVGKMFDGTPVYKYNYKGDPSHRTQMGIMAQDIEGKYPDAVHKTSDGIRMVDYDAATAASAEKGKFADGGIAFDDYGIDGAGLGNLVDPEAGVSDVEYQNFINNEPASEEPVNNITLNNPNAAPKRNDPFLGKSKTTNIYDYNFKDVDPYLMDHALTAAEKYPGLRISSGYRSPERNAQVGGAGNSQHLYGRALDFDLSGMTPEERESFARETHANPNIKGLGMYNKEGTSLHADVKPGPNRMWGPGFTKSSIPETPTFFQNLASSLGGMFDGDKVTSSGIQNALHQGADRTYAGAENGRVMAGAGDGDMNVSSLAMRDAALNEAARAKGVSNLPSPRESQSLLGMMGINMPPEVAQGLLAAGLGMLSGTSPFAGVNIGRGGLQGVEAYGQAINSKAQRENLASEIEARKGNLDIARTKNQIELRNLYNQENYRRTMTEQPPITYEEFVSGSATNAPVKPIINNALPAQSMQSQVPAIQKAVNASVQSPQQVTKQPVQTTQQTEQVSPQMQEHINNFQVPEPPEAKSYEDRAAVIEKRARLAGLYGDSSNDRKQAEELRTKAQELRENARKDFYKQTLDLNGFEAVRDPNYDPRKDKDRFTPPAVVEPAKIDRNTGNVVTSIPPAPNDYKGYKITKTSDAQKDFTKEIDHTQANAAQSTLKSFTVLENALKEVTAGATTERRGEVAKYLAEAGFNKFADLVAGGSVAAFQKAMKETFEGALNNMSAANKRFTQNELFAQIKNMPNANMTPEAAMALISGIKGHASQILAFQKDWAKANKDGWVDGNKFYSAWSEKNPVEKFSEAERLKMGNLKGMPLPSKDKWLPNVTYVMPTELSKDEVGIGKDLFKAGVQPGKKFTMDMDGNFKPVKSEYK